MVGLRWICCDVITQVIACVEVSARRETMADRAEDQGEDEEDQQAGSAEPNRVIVSLTSLLGHHAISDPSSTPPPNTSTAWRHLAGPAQLQRTGERR